MTSQSHSDKYKSLLLFLTIVMMIKHFSCNVKLKTPRPLIKIYVIVIKDININFLFSMALFLCDILDFEYFDGLDQSNTFFCHWL